MRAAVLIVALGLTVWAYQASLTQPLIYEEARTMPAAVVTVGDLAQSVIATLRLQPRALTTLTLRVNAYGAASLTQFRVVNIGWHLLNGLLLYVIARHLMGAWGAVVTAAVFLLHPINSQAVTYLAARGDLVSTTGVLLAVWASLTGRWWLVVLGLLVALTGKESAIVGLPLVLWLLWRTDRLQLSPRLVLATAVVGLVGAVLIHQVLLFGEVFDPLLVSRGPLVFAGVQLLAVTRWLGLVVWPSGLSIDPDFEAWRGRWVILAAIGWGVALGLGWSWRASRPWLLTSLGWVLIALIPRFVLVQAEFVAEHHSYLALVGIWLLIGRMYEGVAGGAAGMAADCDCDRDPLAVLGGRGGVVVV